MAGSFASASSRFLVVAAAPVSAAPLTMACRFQIASSGANKCLMSINTNGSADNCFLMRVNTSDQLEAFTRTTVTDVGTTVSTVSTSTWYHGAAVFSASNSRTPYLDGVAGGTGTATRAPSGMDLVSLGRYSSATTHYHDGLIAEAAIWNVALNSSELLALARGACPLLIRPTSLLFYNPLIRTLTADLKGGLTLTNTNTVGVSAHPRVYYPSGLSPFLNRTISLPGPADPDGVDWDYTFLRPRLNTRARGFLPRWPLLH